MSQDFTASITDTGDFFVAGGTLRPDTPSYVVRPADDELFNAVLAGKYCYVLTPRQMGKSSLMVRTARRLPQAGVRTAAIDLTAMGTGVSATQWYSGLIMHLSSQLRLRLDTQAWWNGRAQVGPVQHFTDFLRNVLLAQTEEPIVIFIDEIDTTLNLDFSDDFFAAIRSVYNERAMNSAYDRLTFVFFGVATPTDLIKDPNRTPFNIGLEIDLNEFTRQDALILEQRLIQAYPQQGKAIFDRVFYWTSGHPYLTQQLCLTVTSNHQQSWSDVEIDRLVEQLFLSDEARGETNIQFVSNKILTHPQRAELLRLYRHIYHGRVVPDNKQSLIQSQLKLSGLTKVEDGHLRVRNQIYCHAFDEAWIRKHTAVNWTRIVAGLSIFVAVLSMSVLLYNSAWLPLQANNAEREFLLSDTPQEHAETLARLFALQPAFGTSYDSRALDLFFTMNSWEEQSAIYQVPFSKAEEAILLVENIYVTLADVDGSDKTRPLLEKMSQILSRFPEHEAASGLKEEIDHWLSARALVRVGNLEEALTRYGAAVDLNPANPAILFERARLHVQLANHESALADLDRVMAVALQEPEPEETPRLVTESLLTPTPQTTNTAGTAVTQSPTLDMDTPAATRTPLAIPTSSVQSPLPTSQPTRPTPQEAIRSVFATRAQRTNAVRELINANPETVSFLVNASSDLFPNLRQSIALPTRAGPTATLLPAVDGMVQIPGSHYEIGHQQADDFHLAATQVDLDAFWIDVYEVTNFQYQAFVSDTGHAVPAGWPGGIYLPGREAHPVKGVTWDDALAYCAWVHKRLPTEREWEVAARGPEIPPPLFPWGNDPFAGGENDNLPREDTYQVGTAPFNRSTFGVYDLAVNVWEWVGEPYGPVTDGNKILRGGRYGILRDMAYRQQAAPDDQRFIEFAGFRCAADQVEGEPIETQVPPPTSSPEPATAEATATTMAQTEGTAVPGPTAAPEGVLFHDTFVDTGSGWVEAENFDNYYIGYHEPEWYHVEVHALNNSIIAVIPGQSFGDVTAETEVFVEEDLSAPEGDFRYGLVLRRTGRQFYAFTISPRTGIWWVLKGSPASIEVLDQGSSETIQDAEAGTLRVDANGSSFTFHINSQPVSNVHDADYSSGELGFYVETFDSPRVHIHYDSLTIRLVEANPAAPTPEVASPSSQGMVPVAGGTSTVSADTAIELAGFWLDRYEVMK